MTWSGRTSADTDTTNLIRIGMNNLKLKLDNLLDDGITDINKIKDKLGISDNELFEFIQKEGGYSTAGVLSGKGTITKN